MTIRARRTSSAADALVFAAPWLAAAIGGAVTAPAIPAWYRTLDTPAWKPPDRLFAPVWTALYLTMSVAVVLARRADPDGAGRHTAIFGIQLALNLGWSLVFFGARDPRAGLAVIVALWLAIAATIADFGAARRLAGLLLLPYLAWVTFATALNAEIVRRNA